MRSGLDEGPSAATGGTGVPNRPPELAADRARGREAHALGAMEGLPGLEAIQEGADGGATPTPTPPREEQSEQQPVTPTCLEKDPVRPAHLL